MKHFEQTFDSTEKNSLSFDGNGQMVNLDSSSGISKDSTFRIWPWHMILKSYFRLGKLEEAMASLVKQYKLQSSTDSTARLVVTGLLPMAMIREYGQAAGDIERFPSLLMATQLELTKLKTINLKALLLQVHCLIIMQRGEASSVLQFSDIP
ncbi:hypothetical protein V6N12_041130 [Hibiscus sabdariffa]|uniref:Uncharacterized protein n=1 Tax=Hibiscus sabdariffa TaxID=183260 RepID=A0ABR2E5P4_9ROSI